MFFIFTSPTGKSYWTLNPILTPTIGSHLGRLRKMKNLLLQDNLLMSQSESELLFSNSVERKVIFREVGCDFIHLIL